MHQTKVHMGKQGCRNRKGERGCPPPNFAGETGIPEMEGIKECTPPDLDGETGMLEPEGGRGAPPRFSRSGNPISTRGADYAIT